MGLFGCYGVLKIGNLDTNTPKFVWKKYYVILGKGGAPLKSSMLSKQPPSIAERKENFFYIFDRKESKFIVCSDSIVYLYEIYYVKLFISYSAKPVLYVFNTCCAIFNSPSYFDSFWFMRPSSRLNITIILSSSHILCISV